jgi:molybdopterin molybdotransferase
MLSIENALELVGRTVAPLAVSTAALADALGLVLAEDVVSDVDLPPFDKSLMDGFAVRAADVASGRAELRILERITAGITPAKSVAPGEASQIMTGAPLPGGVDAVVKIEDCEIVGDTVRIATRPVQPGMSIIRQGTNRRRGETVAAAGAKLQPTLIGALAEVGRASVQIRRPPRVAVLPTGDELVPIDQAPGPGQIRNSNEAMLIAQIQASGGVPVPLGIAKDIREELRAKIAAGLKSDVLVLSGGVSAGALDLVPSELAAAGVRQIFHKVEMKPGKPIWFGEFASADQRCYVFGLPGNPVSSLVCFELFVRTALRRLRGDEPAAAPSIPARLTHAHRQNADRPTFHPARLTWTGDGPAATLVPWHGSSDLQAAVSANAMAFLAGDARDFRPGDELPVFPWSGSTCELG